MVAKITFPKRVQDVLNYNEQKVKKGVADCLLAYGYLLKTENLNFYKKLEGFEQRNSLNERATTKTLHVSLNFSPQDRKLDNLTLKSIAKDYMQGIGFEGQPYLVYCHRDAGHPHLHIVSTTIRADGSRICTHNLGKNESSKVRVELEKTYSLTPAKGRALTMAIADINAPQPARYGKEETHKAIARIVSHVFQRYTYGSLPEYNAALRSFGVVADRGREGSRIYKHGGILYRLLDERDEKVGVPIKASLLPGKPTLSALEKKFAQAAKNSAAKIAITDKIDAGIKECYSLTHLIGLLEGKGVFALLRQNKGGPIYGITFVDHQTRCVFNGSELGKLYGAAGLLAKMQNATPLPEVSHSCPAPIRTEGLQRTKEMLPAKPLYDNAIVQTISAPAANIDPAPPTSLTKKRKRKQHRKMNN